MTVGETLLEALESLRPDMSREEKSERIRGLLSRVGLREDALRRYPHEFSGITHNFGVVEYIADRVAVMKSGKIVEEGPLEDVLQHPASAYTRELLDAVPRLGDI